MRRNSTGSVLSTLALFIALAAICGLGACSLIAKVDRCAIPPDQRNADDVKDGDFDDCDIFGTGGGGGSTTSTGGMGGAGGGMSCVPSEEVCDGVDNNCDNVIDEGCDCDPGDERPCGIDTGQCQKGTQKCGSDGKWGTMCEGEVGPATETCNGKDDDCDGTIDNDISCSCNDGDSQACGTDVGTCTAGTQNCVSGSWGPCMGEVGPSGETCDGLDNDCDGNIDNGITCDCTPDDTQMCGSDVGECQKGTQTCNASHTWGPCVGQVLPSSETCDGLDNDCDGDIDNGLTCTCSNGQMQDCGSDTGECSHGTQTCVSGTWGACSGNVGPSAELCDGLDNNCDGDIDEIFTDLGDPCTAGLGLCMTSGTMACKGDGSGTECNAVPGTSTEEICDGLDNDCDGTPDQGGTGVGGVCEVKVTIESDACHAFLVYDQMANLQVGSSSPNLQTCFNGSMSFTPTAAGWLIYGWDFDDATLVVTLKNVPLALTPNEPKGKVSSVPNMGAGWGPNHGQMSTDLSAGSFGTANVSTNCVPVNATTQQCTVTFSGGAPRAFEITLGAPVTP